MKRIFVLLIITLLLFTITGCNANVHLCDPPYMAYGTSGCCYDKNENKICDLDESTAQAQSNAT